MKKRILFAVEIIVLLLFVGGLFVYGQLNSKLDKLNQSTLNSNNIEINQEVQDAIDSQTSSLTGYTTYALFGIDHRDKNASLGGENSDTIIIASVNNDTKEVKLASVYRDTLLNIGNDTYSKANAAYAAGEAEQAISMLNKNLDLNITEFATVNFNALVTLIDDLGGLDIEMSYAEIVHMNNYCVETSKETGEDYEPIELPERPDDIEKIQYTYHLNGVQATSYCRIRYTASLDMGRTERQRKVIQLLTYKAKSAGMTRLFEVLDDVLPEVTTSLDKTEILQLLPTLIGYSIHETTGFPTSYRFSNVQGSIIVPTTLESNVTELHKFLFDDQNYTPSSTVVEYSNAITSKVEQLESGSAVSDIVIQQEDETTDVNYSLYNTNTAAADVAADTTTTDTTTTDTTDYGGNTGGSDYTGGGDDGGSDYTGGGDDGGSDYTGGGDDGGSDYTGGGDDGGSDYTGGGEESYASEVSVE